MKAIYAIGAAVAAGLALAAAAPRLPRPPREQRRFSPASLRNLQGVHPDLVRLAERALELGPLDFAVTSGLRSEEEQQRLFDAGFSACSPDAGCVGKHTVGRAIDLSPIVNGRPEFQDAARVRALAPQVKRAAQELGIAVKWLGEPTSTFPDPFHWELS